MTPSLSIRYLSFNYLAKPFNNLNIRKAFALAINKDILANNYAHGADTPTNHIVPQGMYGYNPNLTGPDGTTNTKGDQALAISLLNKGLQEEGYSSVKDLPPITLTSFKGNTTVENLVNAIADQWKTVLEVSVKVNLLDFNTFNQAQTATTGNDSLQAWFAGWLADYPDPQDWLSVFFGKNGDYNNNNYGDPHNKDAAKQQQVQAGLDQADRELDATKRTHEYNQLEQTLINDVAWVPISQTQYRVVQNPKLHGFKQNALGITDPEDWGNIYFTS
jgi:peptide/nickel transport system substrate-binding protein/oligopeptide transport system substrate-binding protein